MSKVNVTLVEDSQCDVVYVNIDGEPTCSVPINSAKNLAQALELIFNKMDIENVNVKVKE